MNEEVIASEKRSPNRAMVFGVLILLAAFALVSHTFIQQQHHAAKDQEAISNMRSLSCAFLEFDQEYGSFPSDHTAKEVADSTGTMLSLTGNFSNPYFRQLIAYGIQSEDLFYSSHPEGSHKPDNRISPGKALAPGEVGMSYVYGLNSSSDSDLPLLIAPMKTGTHLAWRGPFGGKAAVLLIARGGDPFHNPPFDLDAKGRILRADGSLLIDQSQTYFKNHTIDIRHPEMP